VLQTAEGRKKVLAAHRQQAAPPPSGPGGRAGSGSAAGGAAPGAGVYGFGAEGSVVPLPCWACQGVHDGIFVGPAE
jgi:hypothetical protein